MLHAQPQADPSTEDAITGDDADRPRFVGPSTEVPPRESWSTAKDFLSVAGTWVGDDLPELLELVKVLRSPAKF